MLSFVTVHGMRVALHCCMPKQTCEMCGQPAQVTPSDHRGLRLARVMKGRAFCHACYYEYAIRHCLHVSKGIPFDPRRQDPAGRELHELTDGALRTWFKNFNSSARARLRPGATYEELPVTFYEQLLAAQNYRCALTGISTALSIDHITPLSLGGDHAPHNLQFTSSEANSAKGAALLNTNPLKRHEETRVMRIAGDERALTWFSRLTARERGRLIERLHRE